MPTTFDPLNALGFRLQPMYGARGVADGVRGPTPVSVRGMARTGSPADLSRAQEAQNVQALSEATYPLFLAATAPLWVPAAPLMLAASAITNAEDTREQKIENRKHSNEETKKAHRGGE